MNQPAVKPVLLSREQYAVLRQIQEQERSKSTLGIAPTVHVIARRLMEKAISDAGLSVQEAD